MWHGFQYRPFVSPYHCAIVQGLVQSDILYDYIMLFD